MVQSSDLAQAPKQVLSYCSAPPLIKYPVQAFVVLAKKKSAAKDFPFHLALTSAGLDLVALKKRQFPSYLFSD